MCGSVILYLYRYFSFDFCYAVLFAAVLCGMFFFKDTNIFFHLLFMKRVPEPQNDCKQDKSDCRNKRCNIKYTLFYRRFKRRILGVAYKRQQRACKARCGRLPHFAGKGVKAVNGAVLPYAVSDLRIIDNM